MADPRASIFASVARQQAGASVEVGDVVARDAAAAIIVAAGAKIEWLAADGTPGEASRAEFFERAVEVVEIPYAPAVYLDDVWQLASATETPRDVRALAVGRAARRAPSEAERLIVGRWLARLAGGLEPRR